MKLLLAALVFDAFGDGIWYVALPLFVLDATHSPLLLSVTLAVEYAPGPLFALFGASIADRFDRRVLLVAVPALSAILCAVIGIDAPHKNLLALAFVSIFVLQTAGQIYVTTFYAVVPDIVAPDRLLAFNATLEAANRVVGISASVAGALLYSAVGLTTLAFVDAASFVGLAGAAFLLPKLPPHRDAADSWHGRLAAAADFLRADVVMRSTVLTSFVGNSIVAIVQVATFTRLRGEFHAPPVDVGIALAFESLGALAGAVAAMRFARAVKPLGKALTCAFGLEVCALVILASATSPYAFAAGLFCYALAGSIEAIYIISWRQRAAPAAILASTFAVVRFIVLAGFLPSSVVTGFLTTTFPASTILWCAVPVSFAMFSMLRFNGVYRADAALSD